jgi:hypothetical protein
MSELVQQLRHWAPTIEGDGQPGIARLMREAADRIAELEATLEAIKRGVANLHRRRCCGCKQTHWHSEDRSPGVLCPECGSQDTRRVKE